MAIYLVDSVIQPSNNWGQGYIQNAAEELNSGLPRTNPIELQGGGFDPDTIALISNPAP